jgi:hypothetical protein
MFERQRTSTDALQVISESRHRNAAQRIAGISTERADPNADALATGRTGAIILYPVIEPRTLDGHPDSPIDPGRVTIAFHMVTPLSTAPSDGKLIKWVAVDSSNPRAVVVDRTAATATHTD